MTSSGGVVEFPSLDLQRLCQLAQLLHRELPEQVVIGLRGTLGAGKTRLAQAIAEAAGVDVADVTSPTFTVVQHYQAARRIHHIDAYRLADEDEFIELGGEELLEDNAMILIEWPERIAASLPEDCLFLDIEIDQPSPEPQRLHLSPQELLDQATRTIRASSGDEALLAIVDKIRQQIDR